MADSLDEPDAEGSFHGFAAVTDRELGEDVRDMIADGLATDEEHVCDFFVGLTSCHVIEHLSFAGSQDALPEQRGIPRPLTVKWDVVEIEAVESIAGTIPSLTA